MKSVCNFIISCLLVMLLGIYIGNLSQISIQIEGLPGAAPVYGTIYNETGSESTHLLIKESVVEGIRKSPYTDDVANRRQGFSSRVSNRPKPKKTASGA